MSLEISPVISHAVDIVLLTFLLVWSERRRESKLALGVWETDISMAMDPTQLNE